MVRTRKISTPLTPEQLLPLRAGDKVLISGVIYTARDASLKKLTGGKKHSLDLAGQLVYFTGPAPAPPGKASGSIGPTTSARMERFFPDLTGAGVKGLLGKGAISPVARKVLARAGVVYLVAIGGAGALLAGKVREAVPVLYPEYGPEAIHRLTVENFPAYVALDLRGKSLYV